jgi:hypothetical protein
MKQLVYFLYLVAITSVVSAGSCSKKNGGGGSTNTIDIETTPISGSNQSPALGPTFPLVVRIKSPIPAGGFKIDIIARPDGSTTAFYTNSITTSNTTNNFSITNTPVAVTSVVEITVTAVSNPAQKATASYKYSRK